MVPGSKPSSFRMASRCADLPRGWASSGSPFPFGTFPAPSNVPGEVGTYKLFPSTLCMHELVLPTAALRAMLRASNCDACRKAWRCANLLYTLFDSNLPDQGGIL